MKNLVVLTGAGMSAESGISTFRDAGGLWDRYPVEQVATPEGYLFGKTHMGYNGILLRDSPWNYF